MLCREHRHFSHKFLRLGPQISVFAIFSKFRFRYNFLFRSPNKIPFVLGCFLVVVVFDFVSNSFLLFLVKFTKLG